ncbi:MAG: type II secretion system protein GspL [Marinicella sp.]
MQLQHILRIEADGKPNCLYSFDAQSKLQKTKITQWSDAALKAIDLVLLLPATWLYQSKTHIPSKNQDVLKKSIPFAIEEELSNDVEDNYYAFSLNGDGSQDVIAIEKVLLKGIDQDIKNHQLKVLAIYSELDWIPNIDKAISVWVEDNYSIIRFADGQAMRAANQQLSQLITLFKKDLSVIYTNDSRALAGVDLEVQQDLNELSCVDFLSRQHPINLYVDELREQEQQANMESWRMVSGLAVLLLISWLGIQLFQSWQLGRDIDELKSQQQVLFQQTFSDAAPAELIDPFAAMRSRMQLSSNQSTVNTSIFIDMVHHLGAVTRTMKNVQIADMRLVSEKLEIQISAPNLSTVNNFHQQLQAAAYNYNVKIGVNELSDDNVYKSILTVTAR